MVYLKLVIIFLSYSILHVYNIILIDQENDPGWNAVITNFYEFNIAFHCANYLPHSAVNEQQLERKRYIGNDIVVILFKESSLPLDVSVFKSEFNRMYLLLFYLVTFIYCFFYYIKMYFWLFNLW